MTKRIISGIIFVVAVFLIWHFALPIEQLSQQIPQLLSNSSTTPFSTGLKKIAADVSAPPPLISKVNNLDSNLTRLGIISWTNTNRYQYGSLPALTENSELDKAAQLKLQDMFKLQYFEHINPQGIGPADLAKTAGYSFIMEGENLALGNFKNDQDLLAAWMNSPGHRANILNDKYMEMGAAAGQGMYQGEKVWLAVQEFGKPTSSCPAVDNNLKIEIDSLQNEVNSLEAQIVPLKAQIDASHPQSKSDYDLYNKLVAQYNGVVDSYNNKVDSLKFTTNEYNGQARAFNACSQ